MHELYKVERGKDPFVILRDLMLEFRNSYCFENIKAMHFTRDKNHSYVRISCTIGPQDDQVDYNYMLDIDNFDNSFFRLMCDEKKLVIYTAGRSGQEEGKLPLDKSAKCEVYYPLLDSENNEVIGCIYLCSISDTEFDPERFANDYRLRIINYMIAMLYKESKSKSVILSFLKLFDDFLIKNNPHMLKHHYNVAYWAMKVAEELGMNAQEKTTLYYAGLLHDIGEIYISGDILNKKEKLTEKEYQIERNHVIYGANLVRQILDEDIDKETIAKIILHHHERYDGKGYPDGLKGEEIDLRSRIICVADAVDSMLSKRSYRPARSLGETIQELRANKGIQFDPNIVDIMIKLIYERSSAKMNLRNVPILVAALNIATKEESHLIQGTLIPTESHYEFHPIYASDPDAVDWNEPLQLKLFYVVNQDIFEYNASLLEIKDGIIYLSNLETTYSMLSYSLFWEVEGLLYINESTFVQIKASRISGDAMSFIASEEVSESIKQNKRYKIVLFFENDEPENVSGRVTQKFRTGGDYLFFFSFEKLPEPSRERIIRRIVRKQANLRMSFLFDSNERE